MGLGEELKQARQRRRLTTSEIAARTRMKVQTVEQLEEEDFSRIAAPIYAKGFIRLYAEAVGLDSQALVNEYQERFVDGPAPVTAAAPDAVEEPAPPAPEPAPVPAADAEPDLFDQLAGTPAPDRRGILMEKGYHAVQPSVWERISDAGSLLLGGVRSRAGHLGADVTAGAQRAGVGARALGQRIAQAVRERRLEVRQIDFAHLGPRQLMALLGLLALVLLAVSSLSRCTRAVMRRTMGPGETLQLAVDPPDAWAD